jgi:endonuclease YncB( thermonuclease family)
MRWVSLVTILIATSAAAADVSGRAVVVDGDTLRIGNERIRLHGIDAPEARQQCQDAQVASYPCSDRATEHLTVLIGAVPVHCTGIERDRYRRLVAVCMAGETILNDAMVRSGWALAYHQYSKDYGAAEDEARKREAGMCRGRSLSLGRGGEHARIEGAESQRPA